MPSIFPVGIPAHLRRLFSLLILLTFLEMAPVPATAGTAERQSQSAVHTQSVVAAGFGFQDDETSSITVKTYDAQSGEVLSAETYELDIKDDGPATSHPKTRIFAGGVGLGSGSLSEFTLRVYDAANGHFLWEGRLNLTIGDHPEAAAHQVAAHVQPRAAVVRIASSAKVTGQPYFVLRARHPETGQLMWSDEFSTGASSVRIERIGRSVIGVTGASPRDIDFRIMMPDQAGRRLLWEDRIAPAEENEQDMVPERSDETAGRTPHEGRSANPSVLFPADGPSNVIETARRTTTVQHELPPAGFAFS
jgi:hypothetical protein